jgi:hypothetical protein
MNHHDLELWRQIDPKVQNAPSARNLPNLLDSSLELSHEFEYLKLDQLNMFHVAWGVVPAPGGIFVTFWQYLYVKVQM